MYFINYKKDSKQCLKTTITETKQLKTGYSGHKCEIVLPITGTKISVFCNVTIKNFFSIVYLIKKHSTIVVQLIKQNLYI